MALNFELGKVHLLEKRWLDVGRQYLTIGANLLTKPFSDGSATATYF